MSSKPIKLLRRKEVLSLLSIKSTSLHERIKSSLFTRPVSLGMRAVAWPDYEVEQILAAIISGCSNAEIQELVRSLENKRAECLASLNHSARGL